MNIAQNWRMNEQRYAMKGNRCETCGAVHISPRDICPSCQTKQPGMYVFVVSTTTIEIPEVHDQRQAAR